MKPFLFLCVFLFSSIGSAYSQRFLAIDLLGAKTKRVKYYSGDYIVLKVHNDKTKYKGDIEIISDTAFYVNNNLIILDSLDKVFKNRKAPKAISTQAFVVGGILVIASAINNGVTKGAIFPGDNSYTVASAFVGLGVVLLPFWRKTYKVNKRNCLVKIIDMSPLIPIEQSP